LASVFAGGRLLRRDSHMMYSPISDNATIVAASSDRRTFYSNSSQQSERGCLATRFTIRLPTHSSRQPVRCAAHHTAAPVQITLRRALRTATIARLSLISRAVPSEPAADRDDCGNFLSGDVRVPASKATMLYASGSSGGSSDLSALAPSSVLTHLDREERRAYEMVGVVDELDVSDRSGESSAESGVGIVCTRGRNLSTR
jgi:hypothetical protein